MDVEADLERGRAAYARRAWSDAYEALAPVDREQSLALPDLEMLVWSSGLVGRDEDFVKGLERLFQAYFDAGDFQRAACLAFWIATRVAGLGEGARASGWFLRCERLAARLPPDSFVHGYLALAACRRHIAAGRLDDALVEARLASQVGERAGEPDLTVFARTFEGRVLLGQGDLERGLAVLDECMLSAASSPLAPHVKGLVYCIAISNCQRVCALDRAREWTSVLASWCAEQPQLVSFSTSCMVHRAEILQLSGAWPEAIEEAQRAADRCSSTTAVQDAADALYQMGELRRLRSEYAEADEMYRAASQRGREPQPGLSLLRMAQGKVDAAAIAIRRVLAGAVDPFDRARFLPAFVEIMLAAGAIEEAKKGSDELLLLAAKYDNEVIAAMAAHARGSVLLASGETQEAMAPLRSAFQAWQNVGAPYIAARIRVELSRACALLGDEEGARLELEAARDVFERLGARGDLERVERLRSDPKGAFIGSAQSVKGAVDSKETSDATDAGRRAAHGLTPRELEVLRLVAAGKTNKAIAKELFLSEKTVDRHVSNIFAKLNVASRAAATAYAYEHKLV
jgi:ATP/maltotriose-dependent transcriptional regulator MalT